jgi:hypothetical protein
MDDTVPDLGSLTDLEPNEEVVQLAAEKTEISHERRTLRGNAGVLRAQLVRRGRKKDENGEILISGDGVKQLSEILPQPQPDAAA